MSEQEERDEQSKQQPSATEGEPAPAAEQEPKLEDPGEAFRRGLGLLWQAAKSAAGEIKKEVARGGVTEQLKIAGRELERAAQAAAKELEGFISKVQPTPPERSNEWPPPDRKPPTKDAAKGAPTEDGGVDEHGEPRDMRIQVDDD